MRALFLPAVLLLTATLATPATAAPDRIAVVDLLHLVSSHPDLKVAQAALDKRTMEKKNKFNKDVAELKTLDEEVKAGVQDSPQTKAKRRQLGLQNLTAKFEYEEGIKDARELYVRDLEAVFQKVKGFIEKYALEKGYTLVLQKSDDALNPDDPNEFVVKVAMRGVAYYEKSLNITNEIEAMFPKPPPPPESGK